MSKEVSSKKVYFWNSLGGLLNAIVSVYIMMLITRFIGIYEAGIFSLGYANAMLLQHVGSFDSRSYQCSSVDDKYQFYDFLTFRICTCTLMVAITCIWIKTNAYSLDKAIMTLLLSFFCVFANISDIFQGNAQKYERLDLAGKSLSFRIILNLIVFTIAVFLKRDIYVAVSTMTISSFVWIFIYDLRILRMNQKACFKLRKYQMQHLFVSTFPLFIALFLQMYIYNIPKYAIDSYLSVENQAVYSILFMPASIVSLFSMFVFKPIMVTLAKQWSEKKYTSVFKICLNRMAFLLVMTVIVSVAGYLIGTEVLSLVYGTDITAYKMELMIILVGSGIAGVVTLLYYMLTIVGKQYFMLISYIVTFIIAYLLDYVLVKHFGMLGAASGYILTSTINGILSFGIFFAAYTRAKDTLAKRI